jgi:hypothetical protein
MKGQPSSCNSQPTRVKFEIPEHGRSREEEKEHKKHCCLKVLLLGVFKKTDQPIKPKKLRIN